MRECIKALLPPLPVLESWMIQLPELLRRRPGRTTHVLRAVQNNVRSREAKRLKGTGTDQKVYFTGVVFSGWRAATARSGLACASKGRQVRRATLIVIEPLSHAGSDAFPARS